MSNEKENDMDETKRQAIERHNLIYAYDEDGYPVLRYPDGMLYLECDDYEY